MKLTNQRNNLVLAGTLTVLVLAVVIAFGGNWTGANANENPVVSGGAAAGTTIEVDAQYLQTLQTQNSELTNALNTMQAREQQFRSQIDLANQSIQQLQSQAAPAGYRAGDEGYEDEEHEAEHEHEKEEHEQEGHEDDD